MKTAEEKAIAFVRELHEKLISSNHSGFYIIIEILGVAHKSFMIGYSEATRWRDPKEELPNRDMQVVIKGGILKNEVGPDIENDYSAGYYYDGVWYVSPTDYYSIEIENPTGWRPIE